MRLFSGLVVAIAVMFSNQLLADESLEGLPETLVKIEAGSYNGECVGYCAHSIEIRRIPILMPKYVFITKLEYSLQANNPAYPVKSTTSILPSEKFRKLMFLGQLDVFRGMKPVYGCLDCTDGGTHWIKVTGEAGTSYLVKYENLETVEKEMLPSDFKVFFRPLTELINELM